MRSDWTLETALTKVAALKVDALQGNADAVDDLADLIDDPFFPEDAQAAAASAILELGHGKPIRQ